MWTHNVETVKPNQSYKFELLENDTILSYRTVIKYWQQNATFRLYFNDILINSSFKATFWECVPVTKYSLDTPFEFVLRDSRRLANVSPTPEPFQRFFNQKMNHSNVVTFPSLGKDAILVVPCPIQDKEVYTHLLSFVRNAEEEQVHALWKSVGDAMFNNVSTDPKWLSTSGLGVYWLHIRIDSRPKYYGHLPYKKRGTV